MSVVGQYVALKRSGRSYRGLCPFHQEKTPSFYVHPDEQYFKCFGCGAGGDVFKFVQLYNHLEFTEARQLLADRSGIDTSEVLKEKAGGNEVSVSRSQLWRANKWAAQVYRQQFLAETGERARQYLQQRQISDDISSLFVIGYAPDGSDFLLSRARRQDIPLEVLVAAGLIVKDDTERYYDFYRDRLMFPIHDPIGQVLGFGGRTLSDHPRKYINSPESTLFKKSKCLYGLQQTREAFESRQRAIVVEGYMDVLMAHQNGFREAVATLGTAMTDDHGAMLRRYVPRVVLVFDGDTGGQKATEAGLRIGIRAELEVGLVRMPEGVDPCDFLATSNAQEFEDLLKNASGALEFKWQQIMATHHGAETTTSAKALAVRDFVNIVGMLLAGNGIDPIRRGLVVNQLQQLVGVERREIDQLISAAMRLAQQAQPGREGALIAPAIKRNYQGLEAVVRDLLRVVLREPGLIGVVSDLLRSDEYQDGELRQIAELCLAMYERVGEFHGTELLEQIEDPTLASQLVGLLDEGRSITDLSEYMEAARTRWQQVLSARQTAGDLQSARSSPTTTDGQRLSRLHQGMHDYAHFAPLSKIRKRLVSE
ncbi:MAG: DNA primase [Phycisphaerae bacterium]|nr:DNA primase [Phycisphaerae bacterium]